MTDNIKELRTKIETKLQNETKKLEELRELANKSRGFTKNMTKLLSAMEERFGTLENTVLKIYKRHVYLQRIQHNLECTLASLEHYHVAQEVQSIVCPRLGSDLAVLNKFLTAMQRLQKALNYIEKHNPQSDQFDNLFLMFFAGGDALEKYFQVVLLKNSEPVSPNTLSSMIVSTDGDKALMGDNASTNSLNQLPGSLSVIAEYLVIQRRFNFIRVYCEIRAAVLITSYKKVKKDQPSGWKARMQGMDISSRDVREVYFLRNKVDREEMERYMIRVKTLQKLMQNEFSLMTGIIPVQRQYEVFQFIILESLVSTIKDGLNIITRVGICFNSHHFAVVTDLLFVLRGLLNVKPEFDQMLEGCEDNVRLQFNKILNYLRKAAAKMLNCNMIENFRSNPSQGLPKDVVVHEIIIKVLDVLEQLMKYTDIIADILREDQAYNSFLLPNNRKVDKNKALFGMYIRKVLYDLDVLVFLKSNDYMNKGVRALFRLVNCQHILRALLRSPLLKLVEISQSDYLQRYVDKMTSHKKYYKQCWNKALSYIIDLNNTLVTAGKLQDKESRRVVREQFCGFNYEMEEVYSIQRLCYICDVKLREVLQRENKEYVLPKYKAFYYTLVKLNFSKNPGKYIKYTPKQVDAMLGEFFELEETTV